MTECGYIPIIDLFAGPGGLGEGFSSYECDGVRPFRVRLSVEKDPFAWQTLSLRSFFRQFQYSGRTVPAEYYRHVSDPSQLTMEELFAQFPEEAEAAQDEAWHAELGDRSVDKELHRRMRSLAGPSERWVLVGGPPCQAYSLAGRSRNARNGEFGSDPRHFLYEEYLRIIAAYWPAVFVMENVKGILTSRPGGHEIFPKIQADLRDPGGATGSRCRHRYRLHSFTARKIPDALTPGDFIIFSERHGIPQARHRVIILGIRDDVLAPDCLPPVLSRAGPPSGVEEVLTLPRLRSGLSGNAALKDSWDNWCEVLFQARSQTWLYSTEAEVRRRVLAVLDRLEDRIYQLNLASTGTGRPPGLAPEWYMDPRLGSALNHEARQHREDDLHRYLFAACYAEVHDDSPKLRDFPPQLLPAHRNARRAVREGGNFSDRFRVQRRGAPATTITSHIGKDGHYYIHPDPGQCRSLTVREAARVQTFPDNYFFCGPRTQQYRQVGNAVPPLLARQLAEVVHAVLAPVPVKKWTA